MPLPSCSRTHCDMSTAFELIEPAGPALSMLRHAIARTALSISACGDATFVRCSNPRMVVLDAVMPSGVSNRFCTKSSQLTPDTRAAICPAAMYMMF